MDDDVTNPSTTGLFAPHPTAGTSRILSALNSKPADTLSTLRVFLDCANCDSDYIRTEITFVDFVRERFSADIQLMMVTEPTGDLGSRHSLFFIGRGSLSALVDTLYFDETILDTEDEVRRGLTQMIKLGLVRYAARSAIAERLSIGYAETNPNATVASRQRDPWHNWVFSVGVDGSYYGEELKNFTNLNGYISSRRVTERWKMRVSASGGYWRGVFDIGDETFTYNTRSGNLDGLLAMGLGRRWAIGGVASTSTSSTDNTELSYMAAPAVEFNFYPYAESTRREFRVLYRIGLVGYVYDEETLFGKKSDFLIGHALATNIGFRQPWGSAEATARLIHFLHDFSDQRSIAVDRRISDFYRIELSASVFIRLVRGLSLTLSGGGSRVRDQFFLPREGASDEEILLRTRRLPTSFTFHAAAGLNLTLGSIYSGVVNSRFGE